MNRWSAIRQHEDSIPSTPYEAASFLFNARLHILTTDPENVDARFLLNETALLAIKKQELA